MLYRDFTWAPEDLISQSNFIQFADEHPDTHVFMHTDTIEFNKPTLFRGLLSPTVFPPVQRKWITGMSDYPIHEYNATRFKGLYDDWYGINIDIQDPKIHCIPLGIDTHSDGSQDKDRILYNISKEPIEGRDTLAYMNFNAYTYLPERSLVDLQFSKEPWVKSQVNMSIPFAEYTREIRNHKFTFCPRGNGYDTHRFWETLYLGSIPIVIDYPQMAEFTSKLPVVKAPSWFAITEEYLEIEYERIQETDYDFTCMRMGHWKEKLVSN